MSFRIAEAREEQREEAFSVTMAAYCEYEKDSPPGFFERYRENIRRVVVEDQNVKILVVLADAGEILGSVVYCPPNTGPVPGNNLPEMRLLAVVPQSRNLGVAKLLIDECERRAASSGGMTLHTTRLMTIAKAMYERRGYVRFPELDFEPVPGFVVWGFKKQLQQESLTNEGEKAYGRIS
jgi:ribosomal protein S18 acetylase RimI-like enzyme